MLDTRRYIKKILDIDFRHSVKNSVVKLAISLVLALVFIYFAPLGGLEGEARSALFILIFAAFLWISEAIPAFAVSLLVIGLEIMLLGFSELDFGSSEWERYLQPWASPLVFLFFAGFIMALAAKKSGVDMWLAKKVLLFAGDRSINVLVGVSGITFLLSMFISNTATASLMISVIAPIIASLGSKNPFQKALLLGVAIGANLGGMGTIIGTPPNAIAVGILRGSAPNFLEWMMLALPPALLLMVCAVFVLIKLYPSSEERIDLEHLRSMDDIGNALSKSVVMGVFALTIGLWLTTPLHHIPTTVISFIPVIVFTVFGIIDAEDIKEIKWDVIILIAGGLSLGVGIQSSGLAAWFADVINPCEAGFEAAVVIFCYAVVLVSNFMSNTAASNIMLPLIFALSINAGDTGYLGVVAVALSASFAMVLPISTPPNAIVFSSGKIGSREFLKIGLLIGVFAPIVVFGWFYLFWM